MAAIAADPHEPVLEPAAPEVVLELLLDLPRQGRTLRRQVGLEANDVYNGYTSCPLITRLGRAMLIEFDCQNNLVMSFPGVIAPLEELWISAVMKTMALKPTYISMLRGRA